MRQVASAAEQAASIAEFLERRKPRRASPAELRAKAAAVIASTPLFVKIGAGLYPIGKPSAMDMLRAAREIDLDCALSRFLIREKARRGRVVFTQRWWQTFRPKLNA